MKRYALIIVVLLITFSCKKDNNLKKTTTVSYDIELEEKLSINKEFPLGDVRRYGIMPDQGIGVHPVTKNKKMDEIINLSSSGLEVTFPKGYYKTSLIISNRKNIKMTFENTEFSGSVQLKDSCYNVTFKGDLKSYSSFVFSNVHNITCNELTVLDNKAKNISKLRPSGVTILDNSSEITIDKILINGVGESKYTHAGFKVYGYPKLPKYIKIKELSVLSSDVNGVLIMGEEIYVDKMFISDFGKAETNNLAKLSNLPKGFNNKDFVGLWLNKNISSIYEYVEVQTVKNQKALRLGPGSLGDPTVISSLKLKDKKEYEYLIDESETTNVVVEKLL